MNNEEEIKSVVIATSNCEKGLYIIAKDAVAFDSIEVCFTERYAPTVEYLLRILRKGFGWLEQDRGTKEVENTKCRFNMQGNCRYSKEIGRCNESIKISCKHYKKRFDNKLNVNYVVIEKVGQTKGL